MLELVCFCQTEELYIKYSINNGSLTNSNILIIVQNFQQNNFLDFKP